MLNDQETKDYYTAYLDALRLEGYQVYVLEYATDSRIKEDAYSYSNSHDYNLYISQ